MSIARDLDAAGVQWLQRCDTAANGTTVPRRARPPRPRGEGHPGLGGTGRARGRQRVPFLAARRPTPGREGASLVPDYMVRGAECHSMRSASPTP